MGGSISKKRAAGTLSAQPAMRQGPIRISIIGSQGAGKSSLYYRWIKKSFDQSNPPKPSQDNLDPVDVQYVVRETGVTRLIKLLDAAELSRFRGVNRDFPFRFQNIVLIAFDLLAPESFQEAKKWLHEVAIHCFQTTILALVGTKNDLRWTEAERLMHDQNTKWVDQEMTDGLARHPLINSPRRSAVMLLCFRESTGRFCAEVMAQTKEPIVFPTEVTALIMFYFQAVAESRDRSMTKKREEILRVHRSKMRDLEQKNKASIPEEAIEEMCSAMAAEGYGIRYFQPSAVDGTGVEELFDAVIRLHLERGK